MSSDEPLSEIALILLADVGPTNKSYVEKDTVWGDFRNLGGHSRHSCWFHQHLHNKQTLRIRRLSDIICVDICKSNPTAKNVSAKPDAENWKNLELSVCFG